MSRDDAAPVEIRPVHEDEYADWLRSVNSGFLTAPATPSPERVAVLRQWADLGRTQGAFDGGRIVGNFRSFSQRLTVVGGADVPADAVTNVGVSPTHRRRGILSRMMAADLGAARDRGDVVATLISAEYPIYGRYGFGPCASVARWDVEVPRAGLDPRWSAPDCGGRIDLVDVTEVRKHGPELHERLRALRHGVVDRPARWWERWTGQHPMPEEPWKEPFYALYRSPSGEVEGLVAYQADGTWHDGKQPMERATIDDLIALNPDAERALWHFVCSIDWITRIRTDYRAPDDLLPDLLPDPRAARIGVLADWLWVRLLDVERALSSRTYATAGTLVLDVTDRSGLGGAGRYRLETDGPSASCVRTTDEAELTLDIADLASVWLGEVSADRLRLLGRVAEGREGVVERADAMFRTARRAWCPDVF
ncbi:GNAT family N-acetyltransferase [Streptomyces sp. NA04227]|uniref:GNAT family N-acetyltransferase n=1 Tax=Streptomyces sp. NA04227 TaxID=2742136 RepID=UPI0015903012|nr:GNAT family N-acetyltransferase [Streptomyces sp. NA04227]QKW08191.1 GNAT family N-acetyltransferase [Streptomyces sp. NA04227]